MHSSNLKILGLTQGAPFDRRSFSGTNHSLFSGLNQQHVLHDAFDVDLHGIDRMKSALKNYSFAKRRWRQQYLFSGYSFALRSARVNRICRREHGQDNAVLQIGAMFSSAVAGIPVFSYHDNTTALSQRGGTHAFSSLLNKKQLENCHRREKSVYERNSAIFTFSNFVRKSIIEDFAIPENKVHVVYAGANFRTLERDMPEKPKTMNVLFVGVDFERKGGQVLLEAFRRVRRNIPTAKLLIAGCSPDVKQENVVVEGFIDKNTEAGEERLKALYRNAAVFVLPTLFEPFGISLIEAMHCRTPCIGTNIAAIPEIISDGETGFLVNPGDGAMLSDRILCILTDDMRRKEMSENSLKKARTLFSWDQVCRKMVSVMQAVMV